MMQTAGVALLLLAPLAAGAATRADSVARGAAIDTIVVTGNTSTRTYVILDEMLLHPGMVPTAEALEYDRNRIYSLGLFTRVELHFDSLAQVRTLAVSVTERWHWFPTVVVGFRDGDPEKLYYGAGFYHNNVAGRAQKLSGIFTLGYDPSVSVAYSNPLLDRDRRLFAGVSLGFARTRSRSVMEMSQSGSYDELRSEISGSLGKRLTQFESVSARLGLSVIRADPYAPGRTNETDGKDEFLTLAFYYLNDTRDLREYPLQGSYRELSATKYGFGESDVNFARFSADARWYLQVPLGSTLMGRVFGSAVAGGTVPPYARSFFGYAERIRGYFTDVLEGEHQVGATLELRIPLFRPRYVHFTLLDIPDEFTYWRIGAALCLFGDTGATWFRGQQVGLASLASGFGGGMDLVLPYSLVVRLQYAWNDVLRGQFILDLRWAA